MRRHQPQPFRRLLLFPRRSAPSGFGRSSQAVSSSDHRGANGLQQHPLQTPHGDRPSQSCSFAIPSSWFSALSPEPQRSETTFSGFLWQRCYRYLSRPCSSLHMDPMEKAMWSSQRIVSSPTWPSNPPQRSCKDMRCWQYGEDIVMSMHLEEAVTTEKKKVQQFVAQRRQLF